MPKHSRKPSLAPPPEVIDPRWLLKALGIVFAVAVLCAYVAVCILFYRSQWQLAVTPSRAVTSTPASVGLAFTEVHFGTDASGQPQLSGWWVAAGSDQARTALVLHGGTGSLSDTLSTAQVLHAAGLNTLLFDYRGFGRSGGQHPTQALMQQDASEAVRYLTDTRHIPAPQILIFGQGVGAALAVELCAKQPNLKWLILEDARGDLDHTLSTDSRASLVPAHLLFNQQFALDTPLSTLKTPKLIITHTKGGTAASFRNAADPKVTVELPRNGSQAQEVSVIQRFLGGEVGR